MIVARIFGGLGNQMFQYAAGRALAIRHGTELALDLRMFRSYALHAYGLSRFRIRVATVQERPSRLPGRATLALAARLPPGLLRSCYLEHPFGNRTSWECVAADAYISGYFQGEFYLREAADYLRDEFLPVAAFGAKNDAAAGLMADCESVAVHVRRGDYVSDQSTLDIHGVCSIGYYQAAVDLLRRRLNRPRFFVFSNDFAWARNHLALGDDAVFVDWNANAPELDLHLMSRCRHHVIANSTFSWWAAWLAGHPGQIVVTPDPWFDSVALDDSGLLPDHWLRIGKSAPTVNVGHP